ncbi:MAG TPA: anti-sigma factor [Candidatus Polarisedimenticolia bacterium]|nr:anti-sigma factor [Candidatus Polarisedimenticolia bacterium]
MDHKQVQSLAGAWLDGELAKDNRAEMEAHLAGCPDCREQIDAERAFLARLKSTATYHQAPAGLTVRLSQAVRAEGPDNVVPLKPQRPQGAPRPAISWRGMALAASFVLAVLLSGGIGYMGSLPASGDLITQQIVDSHVRSLLANHLTDVTSTDQHTVKPWFNGHLDTAPPVKDFAGEGFPLIGGRLDYIDHRPVAAMVYRHGLHPINLFVWADPAKTAGQPSVSERQGYNIRHWVQGDLTYWLISDVEADQLAALEALLRKGE